MISHMHDGNEIRGNSGYPRLNDCCAKLLRLCSLFDVSNDIKYVKLARKQILIILKIKKKKI